MRKKLNYLFGEGFRKFALLYVLVLLILAALVLSIVRFWADSFEASQYDVPIKEFIAQFEDTESLYSLLSDKLNVSGNQFETREEIIRKGIISKIHSGNISYGKDYTAKQDDSDTRKYAVYLDDRKVFSLTLRSHKNQAGFFMDSWSLWETDVDLDGFGLKATDYRIVVPKGADVTINGKDAGFTVSDADGVVLCAFEDEPLVADVLDVKGLYMEPNVIVTHNGARLTQQTGKGNLLFYLEENTPMLEYNFAVPYGMEVTINDTPLNKTTCFSYEKVEYPGEKSPYGMPETYLYKVKYLQKDPEVKAFYMGEEVEAEITDGQYIFRYPDAMLYSLRLEVPEGATAMVSGVTLEPSSAVEEEMNSFNLQKYKNKMKDIPTTFVYSIDGLYLVPDIVVMLNGEMLKQTANGSNGRELLYTYLPAPSEEVKDQREAVVEKFVRSYIKYVGQGKTNLSSNFSKLLDLTLRNSEAYKTIYGTYDEMRWVTYFKEMNENYLTTSDYVKLSDDCFFCSADISVDIRRASVTKHSEYSMHILFVRNDGDWLVAQFTIE